jgi:hypothetical protein
MMNEENGVYGIPFKFEEPRHSQHIHWCWIYDAGWIMAGILFQKASPTGNAFCRNKAIM